ncbi:ImmA/IrrE family metallo-endopeptidase [Patescibacteria group bacterium]|nr:ImmA/IrrE family metallo-endopeptidase [Patescibacteria group bacterium]
MTDTPDYRREALTLAEATRKRLNLDNAPIKNIFTLLEDEGLLVVRMPVGGDGLSGAFYLEPDSGKGTVLINNRHALGRQIFTAAHEYCHYLLDRDTKVFIDFDSELSGAKPLPEKRADCFAAHFLLPEAGLRRYIDKTLKVSGKTLDDYGLAKIRFEYGTSWQATIIRLSELGYRFNIPYKEKIQQTAYLNKLAAQLNLEPEGNPKEPEIELPTEFVRLAFEAYRQGKISLGRLAELLRKSEVEVQELLAEGNDES